MFVYHTKSNNLQKREKERENDRQTDRKRLHSNTDRRMDGDIWTKRRKNRQTETDRHLERNKHEDKIDRDK